MVLSVSIVAFVMSLGGGFTLADRLGAKTQPCRVKGCTRTWIQLSSKALALGGGGTADPSDPGAGMCEPCRTKLKGLHDAERSCERPGCQRTWTWPVAAQLEAFATRRPPPRALCAECEATLASLERKEVACTAPGCTRTAVLTPRDQLLAAAPPPPVEADAEARSNGDNGESADNGEHGHPEKKGGEPARRGVTIAGPFCAECERVVPRIKDRAVNCGINGCNRKWIWRADEQLNYFATGRPPDPPPRRMCEECRAEFGKLLDREVRCRTSGCKKTWTWSRFDQLDACQAGKAPPKAPARMCQTCFDSFSHLKDVERPCRRSGCKGTWTDKRGAQLARLVRGKSGDPYPRYCLDCEKELGDLEDREIACKTENCPGTWTWAKEQQLAAGVKPKKMLELEAAEEAARDAAQEAARQAAAAAAGTPATAPGKGDRKKKHRKRRREVQPPERRCSACAEFLAARKTLEIPCSQCATPIYWPPESQLQTHLGNWGMPSLCGACKRDATEAARQAAKEAIRAHGLHPHVDPPAESEPLQATVEETAAPAPEAAEAPAPEPASEPTTASEPSASGA
jgi:hypothetical protein